MHYDAPHFQGHNDMGETVALHVGGYNLTETIGAGAFGADNNGSTK